MHFFLTKNLLPSAHRGFYLIYKNRETHQSGLHYLDKFWRGFKLRHKLYLVNLEKCEYS